MPLFQVKICGITRVDDLKMVAHAGADAIGLNFYPRSQRFLREEEAAGIVAALPAEIARVGVFVNEEPETILHVANTLALDYVQLHGDETFEQIRSLHGQAYIRAFRLGLDGFDTILQFLADCRQLDCLPAAVLVDAHVSGQFGGTGTTVDWHQLGQRRTELEEIPLILAGGLNPANVIEAIRAVRPQAVDTASGVECEPGKKSERLVEDFVARSMATLKDN
jgi:phosphoribosylanthranilate isomerase